MKIRFFSLAIILSALAFYGFTWIKTADNSAINGAWRVQQGSVDQVLVINDGYFMIARFDKSRKQLLGTRGGAYKYANNQFEASIEFNNTDKSEIGQTKKYTFNVRNNRLTSDISGKSENWAFIDDGKGPMVGTWRSSGGVRDGKVVLNPPRARKTFKLVTGSRFQWAAINAETKEFFGTGGGSYTFKDGKYTETLEFFTKDSTKVGNSLTFDAKIEGDLWHHQGLSSQGRPMHEIWKMEPKQ